MRIDPQIALRISDFHICPVCNGVLESEKGDDKAYCFLCKTHQTKSEMKAASYEQIEKLSNK